MGVNAWMRKKRVCDKFVGDSARHIKNMNDYMR